MESKENLIELEKINLTYNRGKINAFQALYNIDVNIKPGEFVIILGPSGCGKSTLLNIIAGLEDPDSGSVIINNENIVKLKTSQKAQFHRSKMGMIFQSYNLITTLSVMDNVALPQIFINIKKSEREKKVMMLLERFGIREQAKKVPGQLSGGQQQRIGIARAIVNNPLLILADEPVGNLDSESANNVMQILSDLNKKEGKTIVLVSHNPESVIWGTHIIHMKDGKIIKEEWKDAEGFSHETKPDLEEGKSEFDKIMEKFKGLSEEQVRVLMEPLKAKVITESLLIPYDENQIKTIEESIKLKLSGTYDIKKLFEQFDKPVEKGGVGLDMRTAKSFSNEIKNLIKVASIVFSVKPYKEKAQAIVDYIIKCRGINIDIQDIEKMTELTQKRISKEMSFSEFKTQLDLPKNMGGLGLDKRTVHKILREIDLILIIGFGLKARENEFEV